MEQSQQFEAKRFAGKPLKQPPYSFRDVPKSARDLRNSTLQEVKERDHFTDAIAEMVLLCNEAMRRQNVQQKNSKQSNKPLSLEYIADRIDVDDPIFGYFVRTASLPEDKNRFQDPNNSPAKWKEGMLQGFAVVTTFTNWQRTFRWDSMHDSAFAYDDEELGQQMVSGKRKYDEDGSLAEALEATVRCGDPWNEGIVWPRIAELSLLGGLGCGRVLLSLIIEKLECSAPSMSQNYDYLVLQATENSVPFYESMGFVRVGCISEDEKFDEKQKKDEISSSKSDDDESSVGSDTPVALVVGGDKTETAAGAGADEKSETKATTKDDYTDKKASDRDNQQPQSEIVASAIDTYVTRKTWETLPAIAKHLNVSIWDILFLNQHTVPGIYKGCRLKRNTHLFYPSERARDNAISNVRRNRNGNSNATQWYIADENDTPKELAKRFKVKCRDLVDANKERLSGLERNSRLIEGTRVQVSNFDDNNDKYFPYCHWTFPDDTLETSEPSYMMVRKLNRKSTSSKSRPIESSFAVPVTKYSLPKIFSTPTKVAKSTVSTANSSSKKKTSKKRKLHPDEPIPPKRPMPSYFFYVAEMRAKMKDEFNGRPMAECNKIFSQQWNKLPLADKVKYEEMSQKSKADYKAAMTKFRADMDAFRKEHPNWSSEENNQPTLLSFCNGDLGQKAKKDGKTKNLFNKVVVLSSEGIEQAGTEHMYFYVLTYIPDLQWCHLAPMKQVGTYGQGNRKAAGRPIWMLEEEGKEVDISACFCKVVKSRATRGVEDADKEQWDIPDSGPPSPMTVNKGSKLKCQKERRIAVPVAVPLTSCEKVGLSGRDEITSAPAAVKEQQGKIKRSLKQQVLAFPALSSNFTVATANKRLKKSDPVRFEESKGRVSKAKKPDSPTSISEDTDSKTDVEASLKKSSAFFQSPPKDEFKVSIATPVFIPGQQKREGDSTT